jgi:hypothetical protein
MTSLNIPSGKESENSPHLHWIPKLHKTPYKERYMSAYEYTKLLQHERLARYGSVQRMF